VGESYIYLIANTMEETKSKKDIWFKRKTYGYGWYPVKWQGWALIALYIVINIVVIIGLENILKNNEKSFLILSTILMITTTTILILVSYKKGEKPRWQWGEKDNKDK
jgi:uncharacterized membrane protein YdjX (TVP38/TMEM64 family)